MTLPPENQQSLRDEIADLERRLQDAKAKLNAGDNAAQTRPTPSNDTGRPSQCPHLHALLMAM
jgi:urease accessory protein